MRTTGTQMRAYTNKNTWSMQTHTWSTADAFYVKGSTLPLK